MQRPKHEHKFFVGSSQTGKSTLMRLHSRAGAADRDQIIFDPFGYPQNWDDGWRPDNGRFGGVRTLQTADEDEFLTWCANRRDCDIFIDECSRIFGTQARNNSDRSAEENEWLLTESRHQGYTVHFAAQRIIFVSPSARDQASIVFVFRLAHEDLRRVFGDCGFSLKEVEERHGVQLPRAAGEYLIADKVRGEVYPPDAAGE